MIQTDQKLAAASVPAHVADLRLALERRPS
jgi:hypothetical protein